MKTGLLIIVGFVMAGYILPSYAELESVSYEFPKYISPSNESKPGSTDYFSNPDFEIYKIKEQRHEFFIPYSITNTKLYNLTIDCPSRVMVLDIEPTKTEGILTIVIPRLLLDSKYGYEDDSFFILVDGQEVEFSEIENNLEVRVMEIPFSKNSSQIEIIVTILISQSNDPLKISPCGAGGTEKSPFYQLLSPLKQFKSGMPLNEIQCKDGLKLFKRNWEDHPVCVKDASIEKLTLRNYLYVPFGSSGEAPSDESESNLQEIVMANNMCQNNTITRNDTGTFLTCILSDNAKNIFELQSPVYKLETCTSMHGCGWQYVWTPQIQSDLISEEQKQQVIDQILHLPQTNNWPASPQLNHFLIFPNGDKWMANVEFYIAGVKMPQHNKCEYFDSVEINLETLDIQSGFRNFTNFETCKP